MAGGMGPKRKGNNFERELVEDARLCKLPAKRSWASNGASQGLHPEVDITIGEVRIQAKRKKRLPDWICLSEHVDAVAMREDRGETYVVMRWQDFLDCLGNSPKIQPLPGGEVDPESE